MGKFAKMGSLTFANFTGGPLRVERENGEVHDFTESFDPPRLSIGTMPVDEGTEGHKIGIMRDVYQGVDGLPTPEAGTFLIVPMHIRDLLVHERADLVTPCEIVGERGDTVVCRSLSVASSMLVYGCVRDATREIKQNAIRSAIRLMHEIDDDILGGGICYVFLAHDRDATMPAFGPVSITNAGPKELTLMVNAFAQALENREAIVYVSDGKDLNRVTPADPVEKAGAAT